MKNLKIGQKLIGSFMIVALIVLTVGIVGWISAGNIMEALDKLSAVRLPAVEELLNISEAQTGLKSAERTLFISGLDKERIDKEHKNVIVRRGKAEAAWKVYEALPKDKDEAEIWKQFTAAWGEWQRDFEETMVLLNRYYKTEDKDDFESAKDHGLNTASKSFYTANELLLKLVELNVSKADEESNSADALSANSQKIMIAAISIGLLMAIFFGIFISSAIKKPVNQVVNMIKDVAEGEGDLTKRLKVETKDEIGELATWFNLFMDKLHEIIYQVANSTAQIASATQELASTAEEMASGAEEQTSQTSQVATSMEEMSATVQQVAKNSVSAAGKAKNSGETAVKGSDVVNLTVTGMDKIAGSVKDLQIVVKSLTNNSEKIGDVVNVIDDVADQTNLLALNAAIEAARAGEQGRGFAVVADEVRKLAERTTSSTKEIAAMVKSIQEDTSKAAVSMDVSAKEVDDGVKLANQAGASLTEIIGGSKVVQEMVQQIATAAEQQSTAAEEISSNIESIASVSKQNAAASQQTSMASQEISKLTDDLQVLVGKFKLSKAIEKREVKKAADLSASKFEIINGKGVHKTDVPMKRSKKETFDNTASAEK